MCLPSTVSHCCTRLSHASGPSAPIEFRTSGTKIIRWCVTAVVDSRTWWLSRLNRCQAASPRSRGTGEVDAVYHIAYDELDAAVQASNNARQQSAWREITGQ